jgi:hypothetical protein
MSFLIQLWLDDTRLAATAGTGLLQVRIIWGQVGVHRVG